MPTARVNGVDIWYRLEGSGPYLLQVPGAVSGHEGYALVTEAMAPHFTVIDFDPRGYGSSSRPAQRYTFDVWADDMAGLLDAIGVERAHVHGGSMGSLVALRYASRHPDRVHGLVLSGCSACSDRMARLQFSVWKSLARAYGCGSRELAEELCSKAVSRTFLDGPGRRRHRRGRDGRRRPHGRRRRLLRRLRRHDRDRPAARRRAGGGADAGAGRRRGPALARRPGAARRRRALDPRPPGGARRRGSSSSSRAAATPT